MAKSVDERDNLRQSHKLTVGEMRDLAERQAGMSDKEIKNVPANNRKVKDKYFIEQGFQNYEVPEFEQHIFHVAQETRSFNPATGEKLSQGFVQKYDEQTFEFMKKNNAFTGQTIHILHDPRIGSKDKKTLEAVKQDEQLGVPKVEAPANRQRFAETQLHAAEGTDANDPNAPSRKSKVTADDERGTTTTGTEQSGGTEGQDQEQLTDTTPNDAWTVPELKEYAKANDIALAHDDAKADILKKIRKASK